MAKRWMEVRGQGTRKLIPLKPGEKPGKALIGDDIEGYRLETDEEFRERLKACLLSVLA